jgi:hypothetical protein
MDFFHKFVLWIKSPSTNNVWLKYSGADKPSDRSLKVEQKWRLDHGYEAVIILRGQRP